MPWAESASHCRKNDNLETIAQQFSIGLGLFIWPIFYIIVSSTKILQKVWVSGEHSYHAMPTKLLLPRNDYLFSNREDFGDRRISAPLSPFLSPVPGMALIDKFMCCNTKTSLRVTSHLELTYGSWARHDKNIQRRVLLHCMRNRMTLSWPFAAGLS